MRDTILKEICRKIENNKIGHTLSLTNSELDDVQLKAIVEALKKNNTVKYIDFSNNLISNMGATSLINLVRVNASIHSINVRSNNIKNPQLIYKMIRIIKKNKKAMSASNDSLIPFSNDNDYKDVSQTHIPDAYPCDELAEILEKVTGYRFKNPHWLYHAIDARSDYHNDSTNQPLEWLGDAVLDVVLSSICKGEQKKHLRSNKNLSDTILADRLEGFLITSETPDHLIPNYSSKLSKIDHSEKLYILEGKKISKGTNAVEAIIGAIFLDSEKDHSVMESVVLKILNLEVGLASNRSGSDKRELGCALINYAFTHRILFQYKNRSAKERHEEREGLKLKYKGEYELSPVEVAALFLLNDCICEKGYFSVDAWVLAKDPDVIKGAKMVGEAMTFAFDKVRDYFASASVASVRNDSSNNGKCIIC